LVSDDAFAIVSSFNFMSFQGSSAKKPRDECGLIVFEPHHVEKVWNDAISIIKDGYQDPRAMKARQSKK
jgi:hypothetical protein